MAETTQNHNNGNQVSEKEELQAKVEAWRYILGSSEMAVVKCAIELGIGDIIKKNPSPMSASDLSTVIGCSPEPLGRILRFLANRGVLNKSRSSSSSPRYSHTTLSLRILVKDMDSVAAFVEMESSRCMMGAWQGLSRAVRGGCGGFGAETGKDLWKYGEENRQLTESIDEAMAADTREVVRAMVDKCPEVFEGVGVRIVDVGGGNGTALRILVKAFPWIQGVNFDLPHVIASAKDKYGDGDGGDRIMYVGGDMFSYVPCGDIVFIKWTLHDWGDEECIRILTNCRKAIPEKGGKVIIVECVIEEEGDELKGVALMLDMAMLAHTNGGKERSLIEWDFVIKEAGFSRYTVQRIPHVLQSVIQAFP